MTLFSIFILAIGLAMDATAVLFCYSLSNSRVNKRTILKVALTFGAFHIVMPIIGYFLGMGIKVFIEGFDHWLAFILLSVVGVKMILESKEEEEEKISLQKLFMLALATSIDVLIVGITFNFIQINIPLSIGIIGFTAFLLSFVAGLFGRKFAHFNSKYLHLAGGIAIVLIGAKILLEHLTS